jgi:hypothetical protein
MCVNFHVLPNPGQNYLKDIDSLIFNFLWDNKPPKIKREIILQKANQGGLKITDIYTYSNNTFNIKRYLFF